jgi:hypothetical protein
VRIDRCALFAAVLLTLAAGVLGSARAQDDEVLMPDQSAAKAKQLLQQSIDALGGSAFLNVRDSTCTYRYGQFDHSGEVTGYETLIDYSNTQAPFKDRHENIPKRNIIEIYNGDKGWEMDRGGVAEAPPSDIASFKNDTATDIDNILRHRIHEPGMVFRYAGEDIVELKQVDWVEMVDSDNRTFRIAISRSTHLPVQETVETRDPKTQMKSAQVDYFSNYHPIDGVQTPFQIARDRNGNKLYQAFIDKCEYNTNLADDLFTKESLDQRWAKVGGKYKDKKDKNNSKNKDSDSNDASEGKN